MRCGDDAGQLADGDTGEDRAQLMYSSFGANAGCDRVIDLRIVNLDAPGEHAALLVAR